MQQPDFWTIKSFRVNSSSWPFYFPILGGHQQPFSLGHVFLLKPSQNGHVRRIARLHLKIQNYPEIFRVILGQVQKCHPDKRSKFMWIMLGNWLLLMFINFAPQTSHSCHENHPTNSYLFQGMDVHHYKGRIEGPFLRPRFGKKNLPLKRLKLRRFSLLQWWLNQPSWKNMMCKSKWESFRKGSG